MGGDGRSLLEVLHGLLERTYGMETGVLEIGRFVIGDGGFRRLYAGSSVSVGSAATSARTLVRQTEDGVRACIYYPDLLIRTLEAHPPVHGLGEANVDAFATLVEELDHLLCIAERVAQARPVSLFELELHANVSKTLAGERFLAGRGSRLGGRRRTWLRFHLFHKGEWAGSTTEERARYRDAARWALRLLDALQGRPAPARLDVLRRFHRADAAGKLELIERLRAAA